MSMGNRQRTDYQLQPAINRTLEGVRHRPGVRAYAKNAAQRQDRHDARQALRLMLGHSAYEVAMGPRDEGE